MPVFEIVSKSALVLLYRIQDRFRQQQQEKKRLWNHGVVFGIVSKTCTSVVIWNTEKGSCSSNRRRNSLWNRMPVFKNVSKLALVLLIEYRERFRQQQQEKKQLMEPNDRIRKRIKTCTSVVNRIQE